MVVVDVVVDRYPGSSRARVGLHLDVETEALEFRRVGQTAVVRHLVHLGDDRRHQDIPDEFGIDRRGAVESLRVPFAGRRQRLIRGRETVTRVPDAGAQVVEAIVVRERRLEPADTGPHPLPRRDAGRGAAQDAVRVTEGVEPAVVGIEVERSLVRRGDNRIGQDPDVENAVADPVLARIQNPVVVQVLTESVGDQVRNAVAVGV